MKRAALCIVVLAALMLAVPAAYQPIRHVNAGVAVSPPLNVPTVPLYQLVNHATGIHFYTVDVNRKMEAVAEGWTLEGVAAHITNQSAFGTVPLYGLVVSLDFARSPDPVYLYTTSEQEKNELLQAPSVSPLLGGYYGNTWNHLTAA